MPAATSRLSIDLSGSLIRVVDGNMGGPMRCGSGGLPAGATVGGKIKQPAEVAQAIRQLLARTEITETRALVAVSDSLASFRILRLPSAATDKDVATAVSRELPLDPERMSTRWIDLTTGKQERAVYAAAWDRDLVKNVVDSVRLAGLEAVAVELKSVCIARAVTEPSCVVLDRSSNPVEIVLIDRHVPQVWHSFELTSSMGEDITPLLAAPLRSVLRFYQRSQAGGFGPASPVLVAGEQILPGQVLAALAEMLQHPVRPLPAPARVPQEVRYSTYLTCLGLIMRRGG